jgi:hypothetical protein
MNWITARQRTAKEKTKLVSAQLPETVPIQTTLE